MNMSFQRFNKLAEGPGILQRSLSSLLQMHLVFHLFPSLLVFQSVSVVPEDSIVNAFQVDIFCGNVLIKFSTEDFPLYINLTISSAKNAVPYCHLPTISTSKELLQISTNNSTAQQSAHFYLPSFMQISLPLFMQKNEIL